MARGSEIRNTGRSGGPAPKLADGYQSVAVTINKTF
jgi:hypothetical protein